MRVLITGGYGYIGGRLSKYLLSKGYEVVIASRSYNGHFSSLLNAQFIQISWDKTSDLENACQNIDVLIHAAGMNAEDCIRDPEEALNFNGYATSRLMDAASKSGVKRIIYLSTAHVYSSPLRGIIKEGDLLKNMNPYATSHAEGEAAVLAASKLGTIEGIVLRISNAVGAPHHKSVNCWKLLIPNLCKQAVVDKKIELYSNTSQQRDFIAIGEVCRIIEGLIEIPYGYRFSPILNIGTGISKTLIDVACEVRDSCEKNLGYRPTISTLLAGEGDHELSFRVDLAEATLGKISSSISSELDGLLKFCQKNFNNGN